jgi:hypothetical protein
MPQHDANDNPRKLGMRWIVSLPIVRFRSSVARAATGNHANDGTEMTNLRHSFDYRRSRGGDPIKQI